MKILFINPSRDVYGSEQSMLALLKSAAFNAGVVSPGGGSLETRLRDVGVAHFAMEFGKVALRHNPFWHYALYRRLISLLKAQRPDAVVVNLDGNTPIVTLAARRLQIPLVRFCRFEFAPPDRRVDRWCWLSVDAVICPSKVVADQFQRWLPADRRISVHQIYDSCIDQRASPAEVASFRMRFGLADRRVVGCVGRMHPDKRIETAIGAHVQVIRAVPGAHLLIIGGAGSTNDARYEEKLRALVDELRLSNSVTFAGPLARKDLPAAYGSMDVCVLSSATESFGMVLTEAWTQNVPTVASDTGGCREITMASGGGLLAPVGSDESFATSITRLLVDRPAALHMGERGAAWVADNCDPAAASKQLADAIGAVVAARRPGAANR